MKITAEQLETLAQAIKPVDTEEARDIYRRGDFPRADRTQDVDVRYRWDLLYAAGGWRLTAPLYDAGCNDAHIDTALRKIVKPLNG